MTPLPAKSLLVMGILLFSAEAWAGQSEDHPENDNAAAQGEFHPDTLPSYAPELSQRSEAPEQRIRSTRRKGPVDFLSLSLGGSLIAFVLVATFRRRKSAKAAAEEAARTDLPVARVLSSAPPDRPEHQAEA